MVNTEIKNTLYNTGIMELLARPNNNNKLIHYINTTHYIKVTSFLGKYTKNVEKKCRSIQEEQAISSVS